MHPNELVLTPDKLTLSISHKDVVIENVNSVSVFITEILIPLIQIFEERANIDFVSFASKYIWTCRRFSIVYDKKNNRILIQFRGAYFLILNSIATINLLLEKLNQLQVDYHITEIDYQKTFSYDNQSQLYKAFLKSDTGYSCTDDGAEKGFLINQYGKNVKQMDSLSISNSTYSVKLYNKSKQLKILDEKIKKETIEKYTNDDNLFRLELSYTRKSATVKKLNIELIEQPVIKDRSIEELVNKSDRFKFNQKFLKKIQEAV